MKSWLETGVDAHESRDFGWWSSGSGGGGRDYFRQNIYFLRIVRFFWFYSSERSSE